MSPDVRRAFEVFCVPARAERLLQLIDSGSAKAHRKLTDMLAHEFERSPFRQTHAHPFEKAHEARAELLRIAEVHRISTDCDVLSENRDLDGRRTPFTELFDATDGSGFGMFAVIDPERLAFFQGEAARSTVVLRKPGTM